MRLDCLTSETFPREFASREVVTLLDRDGLVESESCGGEDGGELSDSCVGAKIDPGKSSYGDCACAVFPQNKKPKVIAAQVVRAKREIVRRDTEHPMSPFKSGATDLWMSTRSPFSSAVDCSKLLVSYPKNVPDLQGLSALCARSSSSTPLE